MRSRANPLVQRLRRQKTTAGAPGWCLLEGPTLLEEALSAGLEVEAAAATPRFARTERGRSLGRALGARLRLLDERVLASLSELETSQGVLALARRPAFREDDLFRGNPLLVIAAGIQNPGNLGGLLRTAEAAGASGAYLTEGTVDPLSWKALRGSMGSALRLPHVGGLTIDAALQRLRARGVRAIATATEGRPYDSIDLTGPVALLLGREGTGLPPALREGAVAVPLRRPVESLNVGVAAGVILFEAARQRRNLLRS